MKHVPDLTKFNGSNNNNNNKTEFIERMITHSLFSMRCTDNFNFNFKVYLQTGTLLPSDHQQSFVVSDLNKNIK